MAILSKKDFIDKVHEAAEGMKKKDVDLVVESVIETIIRECAKGNTINITGFGKFDAPVRAERIATNPQDGTKVKVPAKRVPRFHAGKIFKESVAASK